MNLTFPNCGTKSLGLYPVVDHIHWLEKLLPLGVTTIQLRIKNKKDIELKNMLCESIQLAKQYQARLFINDYWELAIEYNAYGVHLGQEDLATADIKNIYRAGLRLGISTHSEEEINRALTVKPSYLALGPIFPTTSKVMSFAPQGIAQLKYWQQRISNYPLVAIGGINLENINDVIATEVSGIAMISAITHAPDPIATTQKLLQMVNQHVIHA